MTDDKQFRELMESVNTGIVVIQDEKIVYVNSYLSERFGAPKSKLINKPFFEFIPPSNLQQINKQYSDIVSSTKDIKYFVTRIVNAKGDIRTVKLNAASTKFNGKPARIISLQDITDQRETERLLREVGDIAKIGGWEMDLIKRTARWTNATYDIVELDSNDNVPGPDEHISYYLPQYRPMIKSKMDDLIKEGKELYFEAESKTYKGNIKWVRAIGQPLEYDANGVCVKIHGVLQDITTQKQAIETLIQNEQKFNYFFHDSLVGTFISTPEGKLVDCNQAFIDLTGYPDKKTALATNTKKLYSSNSNRESKLEKLNNHEKLFRYEEEIIRYDGQIINILSNIWGEYDRDDNLKFIQGFTQDVTKLKQSQEKIKRSEKYFRLLFESLPYGGEVISPNGVITNCSPSTAKMLGYDISEIEGRQISEFLSKDSIHIFKEKFPQLLKGNPVVAEIKMVKKDGSELDIMRAGQPILNSNGNVTGVLVLNVDITERKKAENTIIEKELFQESLLNASSDVIYIYDFIEEKNIYSNSTIGKILDYTAQEIQEIDNLIKQLMHPDDFNNYLENIIPRYQTAKDGELIKNQYRMRGKDGVWRWLLSKESVYKRNSQGNAIQIFGILSDITEQKNAQQKLEEKERQMQSIYNDPNIFIGVLDLDGNVINANKPALDFISKKIDDVKGVKFWDTAWWSHSEEQQSLLKKSYKKALNGELPSFNAEHISPNGESVIVNFSIRPINDKNEKTYNFLVEGINITEQVNAENSLKESRGYYRTLAENTPVGVWHADLKGNVTYINPKLTEISDLNFKDATSGKWETRIHPEDHDRIIREWDNYIERSKPYTSTYRFLHANGDVRWVLENATTLYDENKKPIAHIGTITDITERILYENKLRESENKFRSNLESINLLAIMLDTNGKIGFVNDYFLRITGWKRKELLGKNYFDVFISKDVRPRSIRRFKEIIASKSTYANRTNDLLTKNGNRLIIDWNVTTHYDDKGKLIAATSIGSDITEKLKIEKDLKFQSDLIKQSYESIMTTDLNFKISWTNNAFTKLYGYSRKEVIGKTPDFLNAEPLSEDIQNIIYEKVSSGKVYQNTLLNVKKDGSKFYCQMFIAPIHDDKNRIIAYSGHQLDITDEINAQQALATSEERYRDLFEHQLEAYAYHEIILNKKGEPVDYKFIDVNDQFLKELEIKNKSDVIGKSLYEVDPNIDKKWVKYYGEVALTGKPKKFEDQFAQNGKWYKIYAYSPRIGFFATSFIDISDEKKAEQEIKEISERLLLSTQSAKIGIWDLNLETNVLIWDERMYELYGISSDKFGGAYEAWEKGIHPDDLKEANSEVQNAIKGKKEFHTQFRVVWPTGEIRYIEARAIVIKNADGKPIRMIGVNWNITDKMNSEKELNKYKDHLEEIVEKRTAELKHKNAELDNALKVFVGRELTIKNLRNQINELEKELKKLKKGSN